MKRTQSDDLKSSNKKLHTQSIFENTDLVVIILKNFVFEDGRDLVKLGLVSKVFHKCITSPRYDEFIWKLYCSTADPFVTKNGNYEERYWFLEWKKRALWRYNVKQFISNHAELQKSPEFQTWLKDPKKYFNFLLQATPTVSEENRYTEFSDDTIQTFDDQFAVGESKLGGFPDLPKGVEWPREFLKRYYDSEGPLDFKAQINLEQVRFYDRYNLLPRDGMLYFFHKRDGVSSSVRYYSKEQIASFGGLERKSIPKNSPEEERHIEVECFPPWKLQFGECVAVNEWRKATIKSTFEQRNFSLDAIAKEFEKTMEAKTVDPELQEEFQETRYLQLLGPNSLTKDAEVEIEEDDSEQKSAFGKRGKGLGAATSPRLERVCLLDLRDHTAGCGRDSVWLWVMLQRDLEQHNFSRVAAWQCED